MNGRILLDTNIVIALFASDAAVLKRLAGAEAVFVPSIVLGELYFGAHKSVHVEANLERIDAFASASTILACDEHTARIYGQIKYALRAKGRPIPEHDIWIASLGQQHHLTLATRDRHFEEIETLTYERWWIAILWRFKVFSKAGAAPVVVGLKDRLSDMAVSWTTLPTAGEERLPMLVFEKDADPAAVGYELRVYTVDEVTGEETDLGYCWNRIEKYLIDEPLSRRRKLLL
jgi:tRNA(fMet)-specific endonuclease VapC